MPAAGPEPDERALRAAVLRGDEEAWRTLFDRHYGRLLAYACRRTGGRQDRAEEVLQETWLIAIKKIRTFDPEQGPFAAWLTGIATNTLLNRRRAWSRQDRQAGQDDRPAIDLRSTESEQLEEREQIQLAALALPRRYRAVLAAKYEEHLTVAEISDRWQETPKAVESLLTRARAAFREAYARVNNGNE